MRHTLFALAAVVLASTLLGVRVSHAAGSEAIWHVLTSADKAVQTEFPSEPTYEAVQLLSGQGFPYTMHQYVWAREATVYQLQTVVFPKDVNLVPQANIKAGLDATAKSLNGGQWQGLEWTRHQGLIAADAFGMRAGHAVRVFSVIKGSRLVTLTYVGPPDSARAEGVERFIKSLKIQ